MLLTVFALLNEVVRQADLTQIYVTKLSTVVVAILFISYLVLKHRSDAFPLIALSISKAAMTLHWASAPMSYAGIFTQFYCVHKIYESLTSLGKNRT